MNTPQNTDTVDAGLDYPESMKVDQTDDYFGNAVADPYRWLEDENSEDTKTWVTGQNDVTNEYLAQIPYREALEARLTELMDYEKVSSPRKEGDYLFFRKNEGLQNQSVFYYQKGLDGEPEVFLDPNTLSDDGTTSADLLGFSDDKKYVAISITEAGSDWKTFKVMDVETRTELDDELTNIKFSGADWWQDGFFYSRFPEPEDGEELSETNLYHTVYYHKLGDDQANDQLIYRDDANPTHNHYPDLTEDGEYMLLYKSKGTNNFDLYYKKMSEPGWDFKPLFTGFTNKSSVIDYRNGKFIVETNIDAPNNRLVLVDPDNIEKENWVEIIPEKENKLSASTAGNYIFAEYLEKAQTKIYRYNPDGSGEMEINLPGPGSAGGFYGDKEDTYLFYYFTSYTNPTEVYKLDIESGESALFYRPQLKFNPDDFTSEQVAYKSKDGTEVTMFLVHKKGIERNGKNPTLLYGYGGFNISITPGFRTSRIAMMEQGVVYAVANLRGGGEYGEDWHTAGMFEHKQNVFDDFISAAEFLIDHGITSKDYLAIEGRSNGGLLVGACMTQRPDLYKVTFPVVGVMDMLRFHRFTIGRAWTAEYGCADSSKEEYDYISAYSPLHNLKNGTAYPATMVMTADHDDRVVPAHSYKFAATLQEKHKGGNPVLIRIETDAGHGGGTPLNKTIEQRTDMIAFMLWNMGFDSLPNQPES